jgi:hypothetical protein
LTHRAIGGWKQVAGAEFCDEWTHLQAAATIIAHVQCDTLQNVVTLGGADQRGRLQRHVEKKTTTCD